jgi:hypothetical protein
MEMAHLEWLLGTAEGYSGKQNRVKEDSDRQQSGRYSLGSWTRPEQIERGLNKMEPENTVGKLIPNAADGLS